MNVVPRSRTRRWSRAVGAVVLAAALTTLTAACVRLPTSGPVVDGTGEVGRGEVAGAYFIPNGPTPGESPADIVRHFMEAMTATPLQTGIAREFLAAGAADGWEPERRTITYTGAVRPVGGSEVTVRLQEVDELDERGTWLGRSGTGVEQLSFPMVREDGEWRIAEVPNALIVPASWFEGRFRPVSLYFFDPEAQVLVPEPVFVPDGDQLATTLLRRLVQGPPPPLSGVSRTFVPRVDSAELSVDVSGTGVADVVLAGETTSPDAESGSLLLAQIAWTLRQDPTIDAFRLTLAGEAVRLPDGGSEIPVEYGGEYSPSVSASSSRIFGVADGLVVDVTPDLGESRVRGPFGTERYGLRDLAVSMAGDRVAAVVDDGTGLLLGPTDEAGAEVVPVLDGAEDLAKPSWDHAGRLWTLDRTAQGARIVVAAGGELTEVEVPGVTGREVRHARISRDGSRLVAAVVEPGGDRVVVSRVRYDGGVVDSTSSATTILDGTDEPLQVVDLAWTSPTELVVVDRAAIDIWATRVVPVDGSLASAQDQVATSTDRLPVRRVVAAPEEGLPTFVAGDDGAVELGRPVGGEQIGGDVFALTYVG